MVRHCINGAHAQAYPVRESLAKCKVKARIPLPSFQETKMYVIKLTKQTVYLYKRGIAISTGCVAIFLFGLTATAASNDIDARYRQERDACSGRPAPERPACLREAAAAREAARQGQLNGGQANYEQNMLERCKALPAAERDSCMHRSRGEGQNSGSVEGGGVIREYKEITLPPAISSPTVVPKQRNAPNPATPETTPFPIPQGNQQQSPPTPPDDMLLERR
jgi:hypothetical protein